MNALPSPDESRAATHVEPDTAGVVLTTGTPLGDWGPLAAALLGAAPAGSDLRAAALATWCDATLGDIEVRLNRGAVTWLDTEDGAGGLRTMAPSGGPLWGGVDARLCWAVGALDAVWPQARWMLFVESPAVALARRLPALAPFDPPALLRTWCAGAGEILGLLRRAPQRCVAIEATEGRRAPAAAAAAAGRHLGILFGEPVPPAEGGVDPLVLALAEGLIAPEHEARTLYAELLAACQPLGDAVPSVASNLDIAARWRALTDAAGSATQLSAEVLALRSDLELRCSQADQLQEELEYYHAELQERDRRPPPAPTAIAVVAQDLPAVGSLLLGPERDTPPHRELSVHVETLRVAGGPAQTMDLRLVDHHGRAGLVVFGDAGRSALAGWAESGQEDGRGYMLLVPSDRNTLSVARGLTAGDGLLLQALLDRLSLDIAASNLELKPYWALVAARFRQEWIDAPVGLRFDPPSATALPADERGGAVELVLGLAALGDRLVKGLRVRLRPGPTVELSGNDERGVPVLPSWPLRPDARPLPVWELPVGASAFAARGRARWQGVSAADQAFLSALLDTLPALAVRSEVATALQTAGMGESASRLASLADEARSSMRPTLKSRAASLVRAWRGR
jgi:hypothetical protein